MAIVTGQPEVAGAMQLRVVEYPNGKVLALSPAGSVSKQENIFCCGPKKLAKIFQQDKAGDNVLFSMYQWLESQLSDTEFATVRNGIEEFVRLVTKQ